MSATTLDDIGKAISAVLLKPDETVNQLYYIHTVAMTQNQVLGYAREAAPGAEFVVEIPIRQDEKTFYGSRKTSAP